MRCTQGTIVRSRNVLLLLRFSNFSLLLPYMRTTKKRRRNFFFASISFVVFQPKLQTEQVGWHIFASVIFQPTQSQLCDYYCPFLPAVAQVSHGTRADSWLLRGGRRLPLLSEGSRRGEGELQASGKIHKKESVHILL